MFLRPALNPVPNECTGFLQRNSAVARGWCCTYLRCGRSTQRGGGCRYCRVLDHVARRPPAGFPQNRLSLDRGLVKNVWVVVAVGIRNRLVTVKLLKIVNGVPTVGVEEILLPIITFVSDLLESSQDTRWYESNFFWAYATTFNSCQGLTLDRLGIELTRSAFSHGQLYTAMS